MVELAVFSIDNAMPAQFSAINASLYPRYSHIFFWWSFSSGIVFGLNCYFLGKLARQWPAGTGRRIFWLMLLALGIANTSAFVIWTMTGGYSQISPCFEDSRGPIVAHCWIAIAFLMSILSAMVAYRMTADRMRDSSCRPSCMAPSSHQVLSRMASSFAIACSGASLVSARTFLSIKLARPAWAFRHSVGIVLQDPCPFRPILSRLC